MAEKAFSQIMETEAQARELIKNAREEAARTIARAQEETADAFARLSEACAQQATEKKHQAEADARAASAAFAEESACQCAALKQKLLLRKPEAVDAVVQILTA